MNLAEKLISSHLVEGELKPGSEIGLRVDQTLTQDATGTMVMLELEALDADRVVTDSVQYVDHNLLQADERNMADHLFLRSACRRYGLWYSPPGNGVSHPTHMQHFGVPGKAMVGSDSHTCAAGSLGMLAIGVGGLDVAMAMVGQPVYLRMPEIWGIRLTGSLPAWVSAKDVILEMLRRHGVAGGVHRVIEYHGPGLARLTAMDRHVIANMGAELGATTSVFPADERTREYLATQGREGDYEALSADPDARYDAEDDIDLDSLVPLIARPGSPGNVVPVSEVEGEPVHQVVVGSSANPGLRDFAVVAAILAGRRTDPGVSLDVNPTSRQIVADLTRMGGLLDLIRSGARLHQTGCLGCIGMGQAPAVGHNSLRTFPRNFPGRSGTTDDRVWLCSPETAAAAALTGRITDPRNLDIPYPAVTLPERSTEDSSVLEPPEHSGTVELEKAPSIGSLPDFDPLPESLDVPVAIVVGDDVSTDEILPAGAQALPYRSNIPKLAGFAFSRVDADYVGRAGDEPQHAVVGGRNYGQGSSREHAALALRHLGLRLVLAVSYARIHWQNLANFGVLALEFTDPADRDKLQIGDRLRVEDLPAALQAGEAVRVQTAGGLSIDTRHRLSPRQVEMVLAGGRIAQFRNA